MARPARYGFRIAGSLTGRRNLVDAARALAGYAACDARAGVEGEGYLSLFHYGDGFRAHLTETGSTRDYAGECGAWWLWMDLDYAGDLDAGLQATRRLAASTLDRYRTLDDEDLLLFFSGAKGFHAGIPLSWRPTPSPAFHRIARRHAERLAELAAVTIDAGVYDRVRPFRAPNSRHPATGLHKRRLSLDELTHLPIQRILGLAATPTPFDLRWPRRVDPAAIADWRQAEAEVRAQTEDRGRREAARPAGEATLNRLTLDFIRDGAEEHTRAIRLFSAAANLAEFGCPPALAHALLTDAGLDSGLPPSEVHRQIECGLRRGNPSPPSEG